MQGRVVAVARAGGHCFCKEVVAALGDSVRLEVTGLRNPCSQIERFQPGLLAAVLATRPDGTLVCKSGIMALALTGGTVEVGDPIRAILPDPPFWPLARV